ncbi:UNVERIFIED_CONTAM: hypothetical protein RMT77_005940 [Armadillidium vulgare]
MTINYSSKVVNCRGLGSMWRLALRWRGSVYKLIWPDLILYTLCFFIISALYRFGLNQDRRRAFEQVAINLEAFTSKIPIAFVLGFYVSNVITRWWAQFENIAWIDSLGVFTSSMILGSDEGGRLLRRQISRYVNLGCAMALTVISPIVKNKYNTTNHFIEAGFMTRNEKKIIDALTNKTTHPIYWLPFCWAASLVMKARREGRILDDMAVKTLIDEINKSRGMCGMLLCYEWISIPLVYTQIVTVAVWSYFISTLMGRQFLDPSQNIPGYNLDYIIPIFTYIEFLVYVGWLKVAETLVNPFGDDDDDFEILWVIERNLQIGYMMMDEMYGTTPPTQRDIHWDDVFHTKMKNSCNNDFRTEGSHLFDNLGPEFYPAPHEREDLFPVIRSHSFCGKTNCPILDYGNTSRIVLPLKNFSNISPQNNFQNGNTWPSLKDTRHRTKLLNAKMVNEGNNNPKIIEEDSEPSDKEMEHYDSFHSAHEYVLVPRPDSYRNFPKV